MIFRVKGSGIVFSILLLITLFLIVCCTAQDEFSETGVTLYYPEDESPSTEEHEVQLLNKEVEDVLFTQARFLAIRAFRKKNRDICNKLNDNENIQECKDEYDTYLFFQYLAEGRCNRLDNLKPRHARFMKLCEGLKAKDCSSLPEGYQAILCEALLKKDKELCWEALNAPELVSDGGVPPNDAHEEVIIHYYGFKSGNDRICDQFSSKASLKTRLACRLLFGRKLEFAERNIVEDLSYWVYVRQMGRDEKFCEYIRDPLIRERCYDHEISDLRGLLNK